MATLKPKDPAFEQRVRASFAAQRFMASIGATLESVSGGEVAIRLGFREDLTQQDGFLHAGVLASIADSACGYAAYSLMPASARVLSVEFKINMLSPGTGDAVIARAKVIRAGNTIMVCRADVHSITRGEEKLVAAMQATMFVADAP